MDWFTTGDLCVRIDEHRLLRRCLANRTHGIPGSGCGKEFPAEIQY